MFSAGGWKGVTAGALVMATLSCMALASAAHERTAVTTELSAESNVDAKKKTQTAPAKQAPSRAVPRQVTPRQVTPRQVQPKVIQRQVTPQSGGQKYVPSKQYVPPKGVVGPATVTPRVITPGTATTTTAHRVFTPRGPKAGVVTAASIRSVPLRGAGRAVIAGRNYSVWRSGHRVRYRNRWRTFVALGTLGVLAIGAAEFYPYAYIDAPEPYCDGLTEDGCQLVFQEVETEEGDVVDQCVAYCPWQ